MKFKNEFIELFNFIKLITKDLKLSIIYIAFYIAVAIIPSLEIIATANFIDTSVAVYKNMAQVKSIYTAIIFIAMCMIGRFILNEGISYTKVKLYNKYNVYIQNKILGKRSKLKYSLIEDDKTWDLIKVVEKDPAKNIVDGLSNSLDIISLIIKIAGFIIVISVYIWWTGIAILIIAIPILYQAYKSGIVEYSAFEKAEKIERTTNYLQEVMSSREYVDERKLFQYYKSVCAEWKAKYEEMRNINYEAFKKYFSKLGISDGLSKILVVIIGLILLVPLKLENITGGLYMSLLASTISMLNSLTTQLSQMLENFIKNNLFYKSFISFMKLEEENNNIDIVNKGSGFKKIVFKNVSFKYPNSYKKILNNLNLVFEQGKKYALVGENGSGKTTLVKLLIGLYDSYEGEITIDGVELKKINKESLKNFYQIVFQDFYRYEVSIRDFLTLGSDTEYDDSILKEALQKVNMMDKVNSLENGLDTKIGKINDKGIDFSGGQWQRLTIARTIIFNRPFTILDEPTAAIDPVSESKLYKLFDETIIDRSSLVITHRLGAARIADEILVLKNGSIAEKGTHDELMKKQGIYKEMFSVQRRWYFEK